jgi:integrase
VGVILHRQNVAWLALLGGSRERAIPPPSYAEAAPRSRHRVAFLGQLAIARGLSADEVRRLLAVVPGTVAGRRDRALLLVFVLTGRRRTEVIGLTAGDISVEGDTAFYSYRGKGGKRGSA